ncbi:MAG: hypothetical protein AB1813_17480 [Verrucomicrobiota bacterium]
MATNTVSTNVVPAAPPAQSSNTPLIDTGDSSQTLTPQMLIQFFRSNARTNGGGRDTTVVLPQFAPPRPPTPPSSTATYNTP